MINFIVNVNSGKGLGHKNLAKIIKYCYIHKITYSIHVTGAAGDAKTIANTLCRNGADTIVAIGGDGTFHEVINGVFGFENIAVGFIPSGRGNDYARAASLSLDPIKALKAILSGEIVKTDLISIGEVVCLNIAGTGIDVDVLKRVAGKSGKITYLVSLIYCIKHFKPYKLTVTNGSENTEYECLMVGVCNGICIGGGMKLSPLSKIDDGKMNIVVVGIPQNNKIMKALAGFLKGKHITKDYVKHIVCDEIKIHSDNDLSVQVDGEIYENLPLECKIIKGGLKTFKTT